jgi:hypothetical protein
MQFASHSLRKEVRLMTPVAERTSPIAYGIAFAPQPAISLELDPEREYEIVNDQPEVKEIAGAARRSAPVSE